MGASRHDSGDPSATGWQMTVMDFEVRVADCLRQLLGDAAIRRAGLTGRLLTRTMRSSVGLGLLVVALNPPVGH